MTWHNWHEQTQVSCVFDRFNAKPKAASYESRRLEETLSALRHFRRPAHQPRVPAFSCTKETTMSTLRFLSSFALCVRRRLCIRPGNPKEMVSAVGLAGRHHVPASIRTKARILSRQKSGKSSKSSHAKPEAGPA